MNYTFTYRLKIEHLIESHGFLALHDRGMQKKMLSLCVSITILFAIVIFLIAGITTIAGVLAAVCAVLIFLLFPKLYWKLVFDRIARRLKEMHIEFHEINVDFASNIIIKEQKKQREIHYDQIQALEFTKSDMLLFYEEQGIRNTLIIPNEIIKEQMKELLEFLKEKTNGKR